MELTFEDALKIARGCTDYGGGHRSNAEHYEIYQREIPATYEPDKTLIKKAIADGFEVPGAKLVKNDRLVIG